MGGLEERLSVKMSEYGVQYVRRVAAECDSPEALAELWGIAASGGGRVSYNALWVMTHLGPAGRGWLLDKQGQLVSMAMGEADSSRLRLMLGLLVEQPFGQGSVNADFLDFCLAKISACSEKPAVRAACVKLAFAMCRHWPELLGELSGVLQMLDDEPDIPYALMSIRVRTEKKIQQILGKRIRQTD